MSASAGWGQRRAILLASLAVLAIGSVVLLSREQRSDPHPQTNQGVAEQPTAAGLPSVGEQPADSERPSDSDDPTAIGVRIPSERSEFRLASLEGAPLVTLLAESRAVAERGTSVEQVEIVRLLAVRAAEAGGALALREGILAGGPEARLLAVALGGLGSEAALAEARVVLEQSSEAAVRLALVGALPAQDASVSLFLLAYETAKAPREARFILDRYAQRGLRPASGDLLLEVARGAGPTRERAHALQLASRRADPKDADGLFSVYLATQPVQSLRAIALVAYASVAGEAGFARLTAAFDRERDPLLRGAALTGLGRIGGPRVLDYLRGVAAQEGDEQFRTRAQGLADALSRGPLTARPSPGTSPLPRRPGSR